jgi:hypothetical protein
VARSPLPRIDADRPRASRREEDENQRIEQRQLAAILDGHTALGQMRLHEGDNHLSGEDERDRTHEETQNEQQSAGQLEHTGDAHQRREWGRRSGRSTESAEEAEELLQTMLHEQDASADPKDRNRCRRELHDFSNAPPDSNQRIRPSDSAPRARRGDTRAGARSPA